MYIYHVQPHSLQILQTARSLASKVLMVTTVHFTPTSALE